MTKVLITGASGMVGKHLVDMCLEKGYYVRGTDIRLDDRYLEEKYWGENFDFFQADLRDFDRCKVLVDDIDVVFQVAGVKGSPKRAAEQPNESTLRSTHGSSGPDSHSHLHSRQQIHRGAARVKAEKVMAPFALDVRYGPRKFRIACRGPTTVARAKCAICRRARVDAATLRTAERALDDAEVIESAATLVLVDSRSKLPPTCAAQALQHYRIAYALVFVRAAPDALATVVSWFRGFDLGTGIWS